MENVEIDEKKKRKIKKYKTRKKEKCNENILTKIEK